MAFEQENIRMQGHVAPAQQPVEGVATPVASRPAPVPMAKTTIAQQSAAQRSQQADKPKLTPVPPKK